MVKKCFLIIAIGISGLCTGQAVNLQLGTAISQLDWELKGVEAGPFYPDKRIEINVFAGMDYLERDYFNLSSNIGYLRKGGSGEFTLVDENGQPTGETSTQNASLDYLSFNTQFEFKYPLKKNCSLSRNRSEA